MIQFRPILLALGLMVCFVAVAMLVPMAVDYADGLVRVGVQSAIPHPEAGLLLRKLMTAKGLPTPPEGRTLESICITEACDTGQ